MGITFFEQDVPDATILLKFRHLLEKHELNKLFFEAINWVMVESGHMMKSGSIVDATIIQTPNSTKNKSRNPKMHQTKKGNEWHFGMKCHVGVDKSTGYVYSMETTAANAHDITAASKLICEDDEVVYGDSGYIGIEKREIITENEKLSSIDYRICRCPQSLERLPESNMCSASSSVSLAIGRQSIGVWQRIRNDCTHW